MKLSGALVLFLAVGIVAGRKDDQDSTSSLSSSGDSLDDASGLSEIRGAGASASGSSSTGSSSLGSSLGSGIGGSDLASGSYGGVGSSGLGGVGSGGMGSLGSGGMGGYGGLGSGGMGGLGSGSYGGLGSGGMGGLGSGSYGGLGSGGMGGLGSGSYGGLGSGGMGGLGSGSYGGLGSGDLDAVGAGGLNVYKLKHLLRLRALSGLDESDYYGSGLGGRGLGGRGGLDDGLGVDGGYMSGSRGYHSGYNGEEDRVGYESSGLGGGMGKYGSGYGGGVGHGLGHGLGHVGNMGGAYRHKLNRGRGLGHSLRALEAALASGTLEGSGLRGNRGYGGDLDEGYGGIGYGSYGGARLGHGLRGKYREGLGEGYGSGNLATGDMAYYNGDAYGVEDRYGGGKRLYKGKRNGYVKLPMHAAKGRAGSGSEAFQDFVAFNAWRGDGLKGNGGIDLSTVQAFFTDPVELGVDETSHGTNQKYKNYMQDKITDNLFKKTDRLMRQMKFIDSHLSHHTKDADNNSLIFSILSYTFLEFLKSYNVGGRNSTQAYEEAYDDAIKATIDKKSYEAYQFAAPVRRVQDIFQAIIGRQVQTVQEHCTVDTPDDWCNLYALMKTHQDSADCKPVWKHLKVFEKSLDTVFCPGDGLIREVKSKLSRTNKNDIFDTTISVIRLQSSNLKKQLLRLADLYKDIVDGQQNARLKCVRLADFDD